MFPYFFFQFGLSDKDRATFLSVCVSGTFENGTENLENTKTISSIKFLPLLGDLFASVILKPQRGITKQFVSIFVVKFKWPVFKENMLD